MSAPREGTSIPPNTVRAHEAAGLAITSARQAIEGFARSLHADPELAGDEQHASERMVALLAEHGFEVERRFKGVPTAFCATYQQLDSEQMRKGLRHPNVALIAEYDAELDGHTYGRNLNAGATLAVALGLAAAAGLVNGIISVIGCPGSVNRSSLLAMAGTEYFEQFDAVFMIQAASSGFGAFPTIEGSGNTLAGRRCDVRFAVALDGSGEIGAAVQGIRAAIDAYVHDSMPGESITIAELDDEAVCQVDVRAPRLVRVTEMTDWLEARVATAAAAHGVSVAVEFQPSYPEMIVSRVLVRRARTHAGSIGLRLDSARKSQPSEPVSLGAVSQMSPTAHFPFPIGDDSGDLGTPEFAASASSQDAYEQMVRVAHAVVHAGVDVLVDIDLRSIADTQLVRAMKERGVERQYRRWTGVHPVLPKASSNGAQSESLPRPSS